MNLIEFSCLLHARTSLIKPMGELFESGEIAKVALQRLDMQLKG